MDTPKTKAVALLGLRALHQGIGGPYTGEMDNVPLPLAGRGGPEALHALRRLPREMNHSGFQW